MRQLLENILSRQVETFDAQHRDLMRQLVSGPSPHERAAEIVPNYPGAETIERMQHASQRRLMRLSGVLIRLRRQEMQMAKIKAAAVSQDVKEKKGS